MSADFFLDFSCFTSLQQIEFYTLETDHLIEICTAKQKEQIKAMIYCTCILAMRTMHFFLDV